MPRGGPRINAGRPGRDHTVEDCRRIDIRQWKRAGCLNTPWAGRWEWRDPQTLAVNASISFRTEHDNVQFFYRANSVHISERIKLDFTACNYGGARAWFRCPGCDRRAAVLHMHRKHFRCRTCHDLPYRTQREDGIGRAWLAEIKLERRLQKNWKRPKGMHHATRERLVDKIIEVEMRREDLFADLVCRFMAAGY